MGSARPLRLTTHAAQRSRQRVGARPELANAVRLPKSAFERLHSWGTSSRKPGQELWCTSSSLLLVRGRCVITVTALTTEDLAAVLVWKLLDTWT